MKLNKEEKEILLKFGYKQEDFAQIEYAIGKTTYLFNGNEKISTKKAKELLGIEKFLSGISRSAFHYTSQRVTNNNDTISFDSSKIFK